MRSLELLCSVAILVGSSKAWESVLDLPSQQDSRNVVSGGQDPQEQFLVCRRRRPGSVLGVGSWSRDVCRGTGLLRSRAECHSKGLWHRSVHVWFYHPEKRAVLLQRRSFLKETNPGRWDVSVGGHVDSNDDVLESAGREVREELGFSIDPSALEEVGIVATEARGPGYTDRELKHVAIHPWRGRLENLHLDPSEVLEADWMPWAKVHRSLVRGDAEFVRFDRVYVDLLNHVLVQKGVEVKRSRIWLVKKNREAGSKRINNYRGFRKIHTGIYGQKVKTCFLVERGRCTRRMVIKQYSKATMARQRLPVYGKGGSVSLVSGTSLIEDEIRILEKLKEEKVPHVISLHEVLSSPSEDRIILAFECGGCQIMQYAYGRPFDYVATTSSQSRDAPSQSTPMVYDIDKSLAPQLLRQLLIGVARLHAVGVVHKDIKPDNILLRGDDWSWGLRDADEEEGRTRPSSGPIPNLALCDFNTAVLKDDPTDMEIYDALGTTAFSPPEVFFGKDPVTGGVCGKARDVWSVGVTFFTMLTGKLPWRPTGAEASPSSNLTLQLSILNDPQIKLPESVPRDAQDLLSDLLEKDPRHRITSADDALSHQFLA
ncbi:hypothetical protein FOZ61_001705 [Perkinsus olseni]|uniref:Uncharacterized protein n=1 Tax=Perkinsus olseni TaxID=32597 RepID=A0A7J6LVT5_PEROL|nr:hypothetical protein FOZ61_001705 [Perkinsus olseni]